jgi:hypothetical protein
MNRRIDVDGKHGLSIDAGNRTWLQTLLQSHWFCLVALVPFALMFVVHEVLGMSDVMGAAPAGERRPTDVELLYNYAMIAVFYAGIAGFSAHACYLVERAATWFVVKLVLLGIGWCIFIVVGSRFL